MLLLKSAVLQSCGHQTIQSHRSASHLSFWKLKLQDPRLILQWLTLPATQQTMIAISVFADQGTWTPAPDAARQGGGYGAWIAMLGQPIAMLGQSNYAFVGTAVLKRRHCPVCRSENIIIGPLNIEIQRRITRIAIGVKPVETPINGVLKALEVPEWMPFSVRVYSLSELYMTHFRLYCQVSPSKWLRLERVEDFKGVTGGVHFKVLREPDCGLGSRIESDTFGDRIIHTIICDVKNVDFRIQDLLQFRQDQGRVAYDLLRNNCQHFVFEALQHIGAPPTESFPPLGQNAPREVEEICSEICSRRHTKSRGWWLRATKGWSLWCTRPTYPSLPRWPDLPNALQKCGLIGLPILGIRVFRIGDVFFANQLGERWWFLCPDTVWDMLTTNYFNWWVDIGGTCWCSKEIILICILPQQTQYLFW